MKLYVVHTTASASVKHIYGIYSTMLEAAAVLNDVINLNKEKRYNVTIHQYTLDEYPACILSFEEDVEDD